MGLTSIQCVGEKENRPIRKMTRGNQRDRDLERAANRNAGAKQNSTLKSKDNTADIMREKQKAAEEKKAAAAAAGGGGGGSSQVVERSSVIGSTWCRSSARSCRSMNSVVHVGPL